MSNTQDKHIDPALLAGNRRSAAGYQACMGFWDAGTHMNKREWAAACRRTENRLQSLKSELDKAARKSESRAQPFRDRVSRAKPR